MSSHCLWCDAVMIESMTWTKLLFGEEEKKLCTLCLEKLSPMKGDRCRKCSRPLAELDSKYIIEGTCHDCVRWEENPRWKGVLSENISLYSYNDFLQEVIARFKYRGDFKLAECLGSVIRKTLSKRKFDLITPIPLSEERLKERGFNQATALIEAAGLPTTHLLTRMHSEKQSKKTRAQRIGGGSVFRLEKGNLEGKKVLVVDDIYTTGATLHGAAKVLIEGGAKEVSAITLARG